MDSDYEAMDKYCRLVNSFLLLQSDVIKKNAQLVMLGIDVT